MEPARVHHGPPRAAGSPGTAPARTTFPAAVAAGRPSDPGPGRVDHFFGRLRPPRWPPVAWRCPCRGPTARGLVREETPRTW